MARRGLRPRTTVPLAVASVAALAALATVTDAAYAAENSTAGTASTQKRTSSAKSCVTLTGTEYVLNMDYRDSGTAGPSVGDVGIYDDKLVDASGKTVATLHGSGRIMFADPASGHLITYYDDTYYLPDGGKVRAIGTSDTNDVIAGLPAVQAVHAVGGKLNDFYGRRSWVRVSGEEATVTIELCPDPLGKERP